MISLDTKRFLRKKKFWIAIFVVLLSIFSNFLIPGVNYSSEHFNMQYSDAEINNSNLESLYRRDYCLDENTYSKVEKTLKQFQSDMEAAKKDMDWEKLHAILKKQNLMKANAIYQVNARYDQSKFYHDYFRGSEEILQMVKENELDFPLNMDMIDEYRFLNVQEYIPEYFPYFRFQTKFYEMLEKQEIDYIDRDKLDSSTVFVQFLLVLFPLLPIVLICMMSYDALQEDRDSGVARILLSQPRKRVTYIREKIKMNLKAAFCIFLLPMLVFSIGFGIFDHYESAHAPVLANTQGITSLDVTENTLGALEKRNDSGVYYFGMTRYYPVPEFTYSPNPEYDLMELWQFTLLVLIMAILVIIFIVLLNLLCAVIFRNKILALIVALLILLIGTFGAKPSNVDLLYALMPFTYFNPVDILSGYTSYSYLNGILVLSIYSVVLYVLVLWLYNKKEDVS